MASTKSEPADDAMTIVNSFILTIVLPLRCMEDIADILKVENPDELSSQMDLVYFKDQKIPGSVQYSIRRYLPEKLWENSDQGMVVYNYNAKNEEENYLELRFCISGNKYCFEKNCAICPELPTNKCSGDHETIDLFYFRFSTSFLNQFVHNVKLSSKKDEVLAFKHPKSFMKSFSVCPLKRMTLNGLLNHSYSGALENILVNAKVHELLLYSLECLVIEKEEGFVCKFLADDFGKERIYKAREILLERIGDPITIKELSRKVAINECYLKKGFKEVFGTTIFDYYQQQRMEHAKYLLYDKGLNVTDVSAHLGYSSISHFSAAFKKHTGLKPCELLR